MVVSVIDTGLDIKHELMVLSDESTARLTQAAITTALPDLNVKERLGNASAGDLYKTPKIPFSFDYAEGDCDVAAKDQHGVHVSGIVAANNKDVSKKFNGVAPEAQLIGMKVFSNDNSEAYSTDILAAVEDSITLGVDVINLSLGDTAGFTDINLDEYAYGDSFEQARRAGIFVASSAGNEDRIGLGNISGVPHPRVENIDTGLAGKPAVGKYLTAVASIENTSLFMPYITHNNNKIIFLDAADTFLDTFKGHLNIEYVDCGLANDVTNMPEAVNGKIALIIRGENDFKSKVNNAISAGAIGAIIFNSEAEGNSLIAMTLGEGINIPAISIGYDNGQLLLKADSKIINVDDSIISTDNPNAGQMSTFTSWGVTPDLKLKPELTAPGGNIYSTVSGNKYKTLSGTSMASPHVAGAAALMKQYINADAKFKNFDSRKKADVIKQLLMSTSSIVYDPDMLQYSPRRQGSGLTNVEAAVDTEVILVNKETEKPKVELGDKLTTTFAVAFDVINLSDEPRSYSLQGSAFTELTDNGHIMSQADYIDSTMKFENSSVPVVTQDVTQPAITQPGAQITVNANATTSVKIEITMDSEKISDLENVFTNGFFVEGFIELVTNGLTEPNLSIPYVGFYGNWDSAPIFDCSYIYDGYSFYDPQYNGGYAFGIDLKNILGYNVDNTVANYKFIAFAPDGLGDNHAMSIMSVNLLRNARALKVDIKDSNDKVVNKLYTSKPLMKSYINNGIFTSSGLNSSILDDKYIAIWDGTDQNGELLPDGQYYYEMSAVIDYKDAKYQSWKVPVFLDTTAPKVVAKYITVEANKQYLNAVISDNHLLHVIEWVNSNEEPVLYDGAKVLENNIQTYKFDVTNDKQYSMVCYDISGHKLSETFIIADILKNPIYLPNPDLNSGSGSGAGTTPVKNTDPVTVTVPEGAVKSAEKDGTLTVTLDSKETLKAIETDKADVLSIKIDESKTSNKAQLAITEDIVATLLKNNMSLQINDGNVTLDTKITDKGNLLVSIGKGKALVDNNIKATSLNYDFSITLNDKIVANDNNSVKISIKVKDEAGVNLNKAGIYTLDADGKIEYLMTYLNKDKLEFYPSHFSPFSVMIYEKTFGDIKTHWAKESIEDMASKHVVKGKSENLFLPEDIITRAEFITMAVRSLNLKGTAKSKISNLDKDQWYANYILLAKDVGLIEGNTYNAEGVISRVEMAKIISKTHAILNGTSIKFSGKLEFTDLSDSTDDLKYIGYANENGLIKGYPNKTFRPVGDTTRAEAMAVFHKLINRK